MGLEAGEYISDLVSNWPLPTDKRREGDDHLRLIKKVLKNTFPNMNSSSSVTPGKLNKLPDDTQALITELKKHIVPMRAITAFSGTEAQIPAGWALCDGRVVANFGATPDLRSRFIIGTSDTYPLSAVGGALTGTTSSNGAHLHSVQSVQLTVAQLPAHNHRIFASASGGSDIDPLSTAGAAVAGSNNTPGTYLSTNGGTDKIIEDTGSAQGHTHGMDSTGAHTHTVSTLPPYLALAYIIKVVDWVEPT